MHKRHRIVALVLLSSSTVLASPAETDNDGYPLVGNMQGKRSGAKPKRMVIAAQRELSEFVEARFQTLRDEDGYPLVGNMQGKGGGDETTEAQVGSLPGDPLACAIAIQAIQALEPTAGIGS